MMIRNVHKYLTYADFQIMFLWLTSNFACFYQFFRTYFLFYFAVFERPPVAFIFRKYRGRVKKEIAQSYVLKLMMSQLELIIKSGAS